MFKKNFKNFALVFSLISLSIGFIASYFGEPSKEEKVLKALNYDLRFTEKVSATDVKRKPTSEQLNLTAQTEKLNLQRQAIETPDAVEKIYSAFTKNSRTNLDEKWDLLENVVALKNNSTFPVPKDVIFYKGYSIFSVPRVNLYDLRNNNAFRLVLNKKTKMVGFLTGAIVVTLKQGKDARDFWQAYDVTLLDHFENSQLLILAPNNPEDLFDVFKSMKSDLSVDKIDLEIIYRFPEKK